MTKYLGDNQDIRFLGIGDELIGDRCIVRGGHEYTAIGDHNTLHGDDVRAIGDFVTVIGRRAQIIGDRGTIHNVDRPGHRLNPEAGRIDTTTPEFIRGEEPARFPWRIGGGPHPAVARAREEETDRLLRAERAHLAELERDRSRAERARLAELERCRSRTAPTHIARRDEPYPSGPTHIARRDEPYPSRPLLSDTEVAQVDARLSRLGLPRTTERERAASRLVAEPVISHWPMSVQDAMARYREGLQQLETFGLVPRRVEGPTAPSVASMPAPTDRYPPLPERGCPVAKEGAKSCSICMDHEVSTVANPCGHMYACICCLRRDQSTKCAICARAVVSFIRVFDTSESEVETKQPPPSIQDADVTS